jgi:catechol 2,3-dioxygenase-like lactoylglutathione lyase family enzyme
MLLGIDHLVIATPDLDAAVARFKKRLGLEAGGGGVHPGLGTENRLVWFGDSYIELVDVIDVKQAGTSWLGGPALRLIEERGGGFVGYALASDDLAGDLARLTAAGSTLEGPVPGERRRPDGATVRWQLAVPTLVGPTAPPFLIEHDPTMPEWTPDDRAARAGQEHPVGGKLRIVALEIAMVDPARVASAYRTGIGVKAEPWLDDGDWALAAMVGDQRIVLRPAESSIGPSVVIRLSSTRDRPATADMFGCRFVIEPAED